MEAADVVTLAFEEAENQGKHIRFTKDERDRPEKISVIDVVVLLTGATSENAAKRLRELPNEVKKFTEDYKFTGRRQRETPVATPSGLVSVILALPNPGGKYPLLTKFREYCSQTVVRSIGGDTTLADEVLARDRAFEDGTVPGDHPLQAFRTEATKHNTTALTSAEANRRFKLENDMLEAQVDQLRRNNEREIQERDIDICKSGLEVLKTIVPNDERAAIHHADTQREMERLLLDALSRNRLAIMGSAPDTPPRPRREVTFEMVALERGLNVTPAQIQKKRILIGKQVVAKYREIFGTEPVKHQCIVGGKSVGVNTYYEEHADLIESVLCEEFGL